MDREQRRKLSKQRLTDKDIKKLETSIVTKTAKDVIDNAVMNYSAAMALCLHDKLGFGHDRAARFMEHVNNLFDSINSGYLSLDDVLKTIDEEMGIKFERTK